MSLMAFMEAMSTSELALVAAFFIGLMTAVSPCPLATNVTAMAYISKRLSNTKQTLLSGLAYALGRSATYVVLAVTIVYLGLGMEGIGRFLQSYGTIIIGPMLILIGLVLVGILTLPITAKSRRLERVKERLADKGILGSFLLGALLAMAFCPFSGVLYFGMLIPLALATNDAVMIPLVFGIATGLPVIIAALLLVKGTKTLGRAMKKTSLFEKWFRRAAGTVFILVGLYYTAMIWF